MNGQNLNQVVTNQGAQAPMPFPDQNQKLASPFMSVAAFETGQRMAKALASSDLVPQQFRGNVGNTLLALEMANRLEMPVFSVLQSIYIVHGKPSFSAAFLIAVVNSSSRFDTPILFKFNDKRDECYAYAMKGGDEIRGTTVSIDMAKKEGWWSKKDKYGNETSKWQSMPELMLQYRAATFFARTYAPDLMMGVRSSEELHDTVEAEIVDKKPGNNLNDVVTNPGDNVAGATAEDDKLEALKKEAESLGIKFRSDITYPTLYKRVSDRLEEIEAEKAAAEEAELAKRAAEEEQEIEHNSSNSDGGAAALFGGAVEVNINQQQGVANAYPRLIQLGVRRADLNDFFTTLNLNATNIEGFMEDIAGVQAQIAKYYETKGE
jgi:hypothetical protein